jgi:signal peptidase I
VPEVARAAPAPYGWIVWSRVVLCRLVAGTFFGLVFWALVPKAVSWIPGAVVSGSMAPGIPRGNVVVSSPFPGGAVAAGQIITYRNPEDTSQVVVHRVVGLNPDGTLTTKGDANQSPDAKPLPRDLVMGLGRYQVPWVGWPVAWIESGAVWAVAVTGVAAVLLIMGCWFWAPEPPPGDRRGPATFHPGTRQPTPPRTDRPGLHLLQSNAAWMRCVPWRRL